VHGGGGRRRWDGDRDLSIVNTTEITGPGWLMFFWLEREGVRVHTRVWVTTVVVVWLHLVEVLTLLGLESVLTVEDQLEISQWTNTLFVEVGGGLRGIVEWDTTREANWDITVGRNTRTGITLEDDISRRWFGGEVPQGSGNIRGRWVVETPDEFLNWVVVGKALVGSGTGSDGVGASVLHLLDEVLVTLLREAASLLGVKIHVVGPDLEHGGAQVGGESGGKIEIDTDLMILQRNQWQIETWIAVEKEDQRQVNSVTSLGSGHLTPVSLLGFVQVKLGVQTPPALVVLVNALSTNGNFGGRDRTLSDPASVITGRGAGVGRSRLEFDVHVANQITVTGNGHGHAA